MGSKTLPEYFVALTIPAGPMPSNSKMEIFTSTVSYQAKNLENFYKYLDIAWDETKNKLDNKSTLRHDDLDETKEFLRAL